MIPAVMPTYGRADLAFDKGEGSYLFSTTGDRYLDFASGVAVTVLGHNHPHLVQALVDQAHKVWHVSNLYQIPGQIRLAERHVAASFADTVFFGNSGAEAGELAIKLIRRYQYENGHPERYRIITAHNSFHGRTLATLAATGNEKYLKGYDPVTDGFDHVAFDNLNELRAAITPETAGILVEPIQGEGGVRPASIQYLQGLRETADEFGLVLGFDEVQTGMGRTGKLWAHEWAGIAPDVMMAAKGIGGGFPLGAVLATEKFANFMQPGSHGSTYGGNPLATAVGNAVLDVLLAPGFMDQVAQNGHLFREKLESVAAKYPHLFSEVRGWGFIQGLKCVVPNTDMLTSLRAAKLLTVAAGDNVVRFVPPLNVSPAEVDEAIGIIENVCQNWPAAS